VWKRRKEIASHARPAESGTRVAEFIGESKRLESLPAFQRQVNSPEASKPLAGKPAVSLAGGNTKQEGVGDALVIGRCFGFYVRKHERKAGKRTAQVDGPLLFGYGQGADTNSILVKDNDSPALQVCLQNGQIQQQN